MINAVIKIIMGFIELIFQFIGWLLKTMFFGSNFGRVFGVFVLILIGGGITKL